MGLVSLYYEKSVASLTQPDSEANLHPVPVHNQREHDGKTPHQMPTTTDETDLLITGPGTDRIFVDIATIPRLRAGSVLSVVQVYASLVNCLRSRYPATFDDDDLTNIYQTTISLPTTQIYGLLRLGTCYGVSISNSCDFLTGDTR
jgi:hypothetical protein